MPCTGNDKDNCQAVHSFNHEMDITACKEDEDSCEAKADFTVSFNVQLFASFLLVVHIRRVKIFCHQDIMIPYIWRHFGDIVSMGI